MRNKGVNAIIYGVIQSNITVLHQLQTNKHTLCLKNIILRGYGSVSGPPSPSVRKHTDNNYKKHLLRPQSHRPRDRSFCHSRPLVCTEDVVCKYFLPSGKPKKLQLVGLERKRCALSATNSIQKVQFLLSK